MWRILGELVVGLMVGVVGCGENAKRVDAEPDGGQMDGCQTGAGHYDDEGQYRVVATDRFNYSFESRLEIETVKVKPSSDLVFDWQDIATDMLGRPFEPLIGVDMLEVMLWRYEKADLVADINADALNTGLLVTAGQVWTENQLEQANFLSVRSPNGGRVEENILLDFVDIESYPPADHTYLAMVAKGNVLGHGTRMIAFFEPKEGETDTVVRFTDDSTQLHYTADLTSLAPISVPAGEPNIVLEWMDNTILLNDAMGREWIPTKITDVMVAYYSALSKTELEENFLNMEQLADTIWTRFLTAGQQVNFSTLNTAPDGTGDPFVGIDDEGTWVVALKCGSCNNPAPWFLSVLETCKD